MGDPDFPVGSVVRTLHSQYMGPGFGPCSRNKILHAARHGRKQEKNKNKTNKSTLTLFKTKEKRRKTFVSVQ